MHTPNKSRRADRNPYDQDQPARKKSVLLRRLPQDILVQKVIFTRPPPTSKIGPRGFLPKERTFFCLEVCAQAERISPVRGKNTNVLSIPFQDQHSTLLYPSGWAINYDQQQLPI